MTPTNTTKNAPKPLWRRASKVWLLIGIAVVLALIICVVIEEASKTAPTPYSAFLDQLDAGNIASVTFQGTEIDGRFKQPVDRALSSGTAQQDTFSSRVPDFGDPTLMPELRKQHVVIDVESESSWSWLLSHIPWPILLFVGAMIVSGFVRLLRGRNSQSGSAVSTLPVHGMMGLVSGLFKKEQQPATPPTSHGLCEIHGICSCGERKFLSKKERIEVLEEYRGSLKCELDGVEEELKEIKGES